MLSRTLGALLVDARTVAQRRRKGMVQQLFEIRRFKRINPSLGAADYYAYRLYDENYALPSARGTFVGQRNVRQFAGALNLGQATMPAADKLTFTLLARTFGLPVPRLKALYRPGPPLIPGIAEVVLDTPAHLARWLRTSEAWPVFAQPSYRQRLGCMRLTGYESNTDSIAVSGHQSIPVAAFVDMVIGKMPRRDYAPELGWFFLEEPRPHPEIARVLGKDTISVLRLILIRDSAGVEFVAAFLNIDTGVNGQDEPPKTPALVAEVDLDTGRLGQALNGIWPHANIVTKAPATGMAIEGFVLPIWGQARALCERSASLFPLIQMQDWHIALTDTGPSFLELGDLASVQRLQLWGRGLLTPRVRKLLAESGNKRFAWLSNT